MTLPQMSIKHVVLEEFFLADMALKLGLFSTLVFDMTRQMPFVFVTPSTSLAMESQMEWADDARA